MQLSPLMEQYKSVKDEYHDCVLFYRLGDFYEMFFEDAVNVSAELELALTGKNCGLDKRAAMCGIPYHSYETYLSRLVGKNYRVAICEQVEDPALAKGLVRREVIRIVTPGTDMSAEALDEKSNSFLLCVIFDGHAFGIAATDISTGEFYITECSAAPEAHDEVLRYNPREILCNKEIEISGLDLNDIDPSGNLRPSFIEERDRAEGTDCLSEHFGGAEETSVMSRDYPSGMIAAANLFMYLKNTQKNDLSNLTKISTYCRSRYMVIDNSTRRNLELIETMRDKEKKGSLLWVIDKSRTAMGGRLIKSFIEQPLLDPEEINLRLDCVEELKNNMIDREEIREYLGSVYDLERLSGRISYRSASPRDLKAFGSSLYTLPAVKDLLKSFNSSILKEIYGSFDTLYDLFELTDNAISEDAPLTIKEGGIIKPGFNSEVDSLRNAKTEGKNWLLELEAKNREETGIRNLRIKFNKVFGYYFEVTNSFKDMVPDDWIRKQTLTGAERYTNEELKNLEDKILHAEDRLFKLEYDIFTQIRETISENITRILHTAHSIALIDAMCSIALVAERNGYVRPLVDDSAIIDIIEGRHPVIEQIIGRENFVDNDCLLNENASRVLLITGPNMAGKSTYMRQTALIVLMAQCGFFVPAKKAHIGTVDRIFTRVGASDDLSSGQSTFMVEMNEVSVIVRNATSRSLIILDEIGRGTSTFDGLAIAWAVLEHICNKKLIGAKTMFATHYHELNELEGRLEGVINYCVAVKEEGEDIVFLRKIVRGGANRSYGIEVAKLAGLPRSIIKRAKDITKLLAGDEITDRIENDLSPRRKRNTNTVGEGQFNFFDNEIKKETDVENGKTEEIIRQIRELDITQLTPVDCLNFLSKIKTDLER
ncbi:MAG: DNA mismatch repair protein MutS [Lachnospiraceae bacterium]|nr:DNA mismatch repair protein MutS [Lachnospiraceae bacterium]